MILTEDEAKTKRCQESFPAAEGLSLGGTAEAGLFPPSVSFGSSGGYVKQTAPLMCIGSACMAWRWRLSGAFPRDKGDDYSKGYCGKAGKP